MLPLALLLAQAFDPAMPPSVPAAEGAVVSLMTMRYVEIRPGDGEVAAPGKQYTVHYTGWLRDGTKFDSSVDRNEPFEFVQGRRLVISGWETGFEGMRTGGKRRLFIPYQLAYGEAGRGAIPPKAELIFDVELLKVSDAPETKAALDVLAPFDEIERKVLALAKAVPEEKFGWRPAPGVRTFGEVFLHIAQGNRLLLRIAAGANSEPPSTAAPASKDQILALRAESFVEARKAMEAATTRSLARETEVFGRKLPLRSVFVSLDSHASEHLGQAIAYARMNGITPPWTVAPSIP
jgi:uncharacterized damage-inducible protein DinB